MTPTEGQTTTEAKGATVLAEISAVLAKHGASLFFSAPATLWVDGESVGEVWHDDCGDGSTLTWVDPATGAQP